MDCASNGRHCVRSICIMCALVQQGLIAPISRVILSADLKLLEEAKCAISSAEEDAKKDSTQHDRGKGLSTMMMIVEGWGSSRCFQLRLDDSS